MGNLAAIAAIEDDREQNPRWQCVKCDYITEDVCRLRGSLLVVLVRPHLHVT